MKIEILNKSQDTTSRECIAANEMQKMIKETIPNYNEVSGNISIVYSLTMCGQEVRDLDLMLVCNLNRCVLENYYTNDPKYAKKNLVVDDFCCAIELKEQPDNRVEIQNTHVYVEYKDSWKDATEQNEKQRYALSSFLKSTCNTNVYVTNFVWLKSLTYSQLNQKSLGIPIAALPQEFTFKDIIDICIIQGLKPRYNRDENSYHLTSDMGGNVGNYIDAINESIFSIKPTPSLFTMDKLSILMQDIANNRLHDTHFGQNRIIFEGKPGTGKTFFLLQSALKLANADNGNRCLLLTYNHALVSDIRRLLHFMEIPDGVDSYTIQVQTLHSFFMQLMKFLGVDTTRIYGYNFDKEYLISLKELNNIIKELMDDKDIQVLKDDNSLAIDWDYILIDEAQDWNPFEKEILDKVYGINRTIVANGGKQFLRGNKLLRWDGEKEQLTLGRRQKSLLIDFVNLFADEVNLKWKLKSDKDFHGGRVIIRKNYDNILHKQLERYCKENKCDNYDILFLVPPKLTEKDNNGNSYFKNIDTWEQVGIQIFDGTNPRKREQYATGVNECRLYQYESCRGLEGWVTVCLQLDVLYEQKMKDYIDEEDELVLESPEERKLKFVNTWMMMPLTRAIDTLIITLKNPRSKMGQILKQIAEKQSDFVSWEIND